MRFGKARLLRLNKIYGFVTRFLASSTLSPSFARKVSTNLSSIACPSSTFLYVPTTAFSTALYVAVTFSAIFSFASINLLITAPPHFKPTHIGIRQSRSTMPTIPTRIPGIIIPHIMIIHIPNPNTRAAAIPKITLPITLKFGLPSGFPLITRRTIIVIARMTAPTAAVITPSVKFAFHSGSRQMHIPSANASPPTVPSKRDTKFCFFISVSSIVFVVCFVIIYYTMDF